MRARGPLRVVDICSGRGSLSRILDCSFDGPSGAKLWVTGAGDDGGDEDGDTADSP
jgi:hypothetical protein